MFTPLVHLPPPSLNIYFYSPLDFSPSLFGAPTVKMYEKKVYLLEKAVIVKSLKARYNSTLTSTIIHDWTRGLENKGAAKQKGEPPYFFRTPPRGGVRKKKWGAKRKGGARTPRTPPEYAPDRELLNQI